MHCQKCQSIEIDDDGVCLVCGFRAEEGAPAGDGSDAILELEDGIIEEGASAPGGEPADESLEGQAELPEWRLELSRRLQEIKSKREGSGINSSPPLTSPHGNLSAPGRPLSERQDSLLDKPSPPRRPRRAARPVIPVLPLDRDAAPEPAVASAPTPASARPEPVEPGGFALPEKAPQAQREEPVPAPLPPDVIRDIIDKAMVRPSSDPQPAPPAAVVDAIPTDRTFVAGGDSQPNPEVREFLPPEEDLPEGKFILLSRTLAGLVDQIIVLICASSFVFAVDVLEGIDVFDGTSLLHYFLLLLATYFVYSVFFLSTGRQTIGMMLTDLRLVAPPGRSLKMPQILVRCCVFLLGSAFLGVGLLWGFFDRQARCLHDRLSQSLVVRVSLRQ